MSEPLAIVVLLLAATGTALVTGLGAIPVFALGGRRAAALRAPLIGLAAGVMTVASIVGLILPAIEEDGSIGVPLGATAGVAFLLAGRAILHRHDDIRVGSLSGAKVTTAILVFSVLLVHSLPEGFAIGTAYASETAGLDVFVITAIALQNIPEGTSVAIPMAAAGFRAAQQFWAAVATSLPQPLGAVVAYLLVEQVQGLLPVSFAFAGGAMLALVAVELVPGAAAERRPAASLAGVAAGAGAMLALSRVLGV